MTRKKFEAYVQIQKSGVTNMWNVDKVITLVHRFFKVKLTDEDCFDIMKNYSTYKKEFSE